MKKVNTNDVYNDYSDFLNDHKEEVLRNAASAIDPVKMGMNRHEAMTLLGAMKNCGFSRENFAAIMQKSPEDKGTFAKQWGRFSGTGREYGEAGEGTIFDYAKRCGWTWPRPEDITGDRAAESSRKTQKPVPAIPDLCAQWRDDFTLACLMDSQQYTGKPVKVGAIRSREPIPTPAPEQFTVQDFARAVTSGRTFYPTVYSKELTGHDDTGKPIYYYRAIEQQLFVVDIDNEETYRGDDGKDHKRRIKEPLTIDAAREICDKVGIAPFMIYETFSSKAHREDPAEPYQKFRLCFALDKPLTVQEVGERGLFAVARYFIGLFGQSADTKTTDPARLIYGTDERDRAHIYKRILDKKKLLQRVFTSQEPAQTAPEAPETPESMTREEYLQTSAAGYMAALDALITASASSPAISTGFMELDRILDGGLYSGLYILGAISSLGKTTFALQVADNIAKQGHDVLIFSLEMARAELMAKSISRITFQTTKYDSDAKTTRGILAGSRYAKYSQKEVDLIQTAKGHYMQYAQHIFIHEGIGDIGVERVKEEVARHVALTGARPVVLIDYLQILAPYDPRCSDKQNTDKAVLELKRLSRDSDLPVIGISSFNRESYKESSGNRGRVTAVDFKESGAIEYSADVLLGLEFKAAGTKEYSEKTEKQKTPREIKLVVLKNRNGKAWQSTCFDYYPMFNYYREA